MKVNSLNNLLMIVSSIVKCDYECTQNEGAYHLLRNGEVIQSNLSFEQCAYVTIGMYLIARDMRGGQSCKD